MKRVLLDAKLRLQSGVKRLEDMRAVFPESRHSIDGVLEMDFRPALERVDYLLSLQE